MVRNVNRGQRRVGRKQEPFAHFLVYFVHSLQLKATNNRDQLTGGLVYCSVMRASVCRVANCFTHERILISIYKWSHNLLIITPEIRARFMEGFSSHW